MILSVKLEEADIAARARLWERGCLRSRAKDFEDATDKPGRAT
jgi:hypothetical protein